MSGLTGVDDARGILDNSPGFLRLTVFYFDGDAAPGKAFDGRVEEVSIRHGALLRIVS